MRQADNVETRRSWFAHGAAATAGGLASLGSFQSSTAAESDQALIAITLDLEMSRNFPTRDSLHWDYEKGNLNDETKRYAVEAARRVKAAGGIIHFFAVGRVFEQENVDWAMELLRQGHRIGNHTYDHVNVLASKPEELQFRFRRAPWLIRGQSVHEVIRQNVHLCELALRERLGKKSDGFRTPGGFHNGLRDHPEVRRILRDSGYSWVSSLYPQHPYSKPMEEPTAEVLDGIVAALSSAQPFVYPDGLIEIPMSPISDIGAFRTCRWELDWFLQSIGRSVGWVIDHRAVFDFLAHPSCLYVVDPEFQAIDLICKLVAAAGERATIVDLDTIASRVTT